MKRPGIGDFSLGAMAGGVVGAMGGLAAIGLPSAILGKSLALLFHYPILSLICWVVGGVVGWLVGGQIGPRLGMKFRSPGAEIAGGVLGGLVPVLLIASWSWHMLTHPDPQQSEPRNESQPAEISGPEQSH
jgi:hypothetical protein